MLRRNLPTDGWRKSSYSDGADADCVEYLPLPAGEIAIRDSKTPSHGAFIFPVPTWLTFVHAIKSDHVR
ncbi:DUF397 domain-containing protein [Streptomyces sp. S6]